MKTGLPRHLMITYFLISFQTLGVRYLETYVFTLGNSSKVDFDLSLSQNVGRCGHVDEEVW